MVALLFSIVIIFLLCHSTRLGLNIYEAIQVSIQHLNAKLNLQNDDNKNKAIANKSIATNKAKTSDVQRGYTQTTPLRKTTTLTVNIGQNQSNGSVDWARKEAIMGAAVAKGVSADKSDVSEPQLSNAEPAADPAVRKLVYSQYRGMLKNYSSKD